MAVRIVVPFSFVSAALVATLVAYRADRPPALAFGNRLIFAGELLLFGFYGLLLVLVPLVRAVAGGELPIELTTRGARFAEKEAEVSLASDQVVLERVGSLEEALADQEVQSEARARETSEGMTDFASDLTVLRERLDKFERKVR